MNQAVEDPRWAMELAHVVQGKSRRERDTISREAMRLLPEALRDLEDINRIFEDISSENFNGKTPESIQSNFKELLQRHKNRLKSPNLNVLKDDGILVSPMDEDSQHISQAWTVFRYYKTMSEETARNYPSGEITPSASDPTKFLSQVRLMRGILYTEIEFHESVAAMRQSGMAFPSTTGLGLEKGIGFGLLKKWARFYSGDSLTVGNKTTKLINNIQSAWKALSQSAQLVSGGVIELNRSIDIDTFPVSSTLKQPEFAEVMANAKTRIKDGSAPVIVALPWAQTKADFLLSIEKTSQTPSEVETLGGQQVVRFHAGPLFSDPTTAENKMVQLLENIGKEKPSVVVIDLDELVSDLFLLETTDVASKKLQENFINRMLAEWERLQDKPTLLFLTSDDNHSFYLPERVSQQALRVEPTRESVHLSLLETLEGIRQTHPSLTVENGVDTYILNQIYGESSLTLPDAQRMLAWVAAQKASQGQPMRVADLRGEIAQLPVIDKLPIARRVRAVAGKVTPEIREKIYRIANELRRARASKDEKEASRKEQYLDTVLGLFFFWKNTASKPPEERKTVDPNFRAQAKARFKQKYSGLDHIFDQLFDLCVLPKLGTEHSANAPPSDIPLLYGSPGVGKTSLGHAIAEMFGNDEHGDPFYKFAEISLAGESDGSKITGFSSTYAKSSTGAPLQLFRQAGTGKVVLLIDELDKANRALLESLTRLLDQTNPFMDSYLSSEFPINLRDVQIVLTANSLEFLKDHTQLRDRVKIIHVPDYQPATLEQIATRHLLPQVMAEESLEDYISVPDPAAFVNKLLTDYPSIRSPRSIKKTIEFVLREAFNRQVGPGKPDPLATKFEITPDDIQIYLGPPQPHPQTGILPRDPGEVAMLAAGFDDIFWVRAGREPGPPPKELVNQTIGHVEGEMQISGAIAVRIANKRKKTEYNWILNTSHPDIEKSGNSAGLAMGLAVVSEQEDVSVRPGFAVTGALKTNGEVAEVAGLDEKIPSGLHHGIHSFLLPRQNMDELLNIMVYNPSLSGVVLRKENDVLTETLVFPQDVPEVIPGDPIMAPKDWESLFTETDGVQIVPSKFAGINGWQVEGTPEAIAKWLSHKPALVPLTNAPTYFLCSTIDEAIEFSLETPSTTNESKEHHLTRLGVKHVDKRTLPERAPQTREKSTEPAEKAKTTLEIIPLQSPPVSLTPPGRGRDPLKIIGITPNIVSKGIAYRENYFATLTRIIEKAAEHNALEGLRATIALSIACQDLFTSIKRKESVRGISLAGIDYEQIERGLRKIDSFKNQAKDIITKSSDSEETVKSKIRSFLDGVDGIGNLINELTKISPDPSQSNDYRRLLIEHWVERYFFGRENISNSDLGLSMLALRGALDIQNGIDINVLQERTPPKRDRGTSPPDPIDEAAGRVTPYRTGSHGGILTFTVEEEAKPFLLDSLAAATQTQSVETHPITFLEINFSAPALSPTDTNSITRLLNIVNQARAAGGTGLVVDLDRLFDTYGNRTAGVLTKMVQLAQGLQPGTNSVQSFLPLPLIFVGKEQSYYRASDICPAFDGLALVTTVEAELAVLIRRTANTLCANQQLYFSNDAINYAVGRVKHSGYDTAFQAMKSALGKSIGKDEMVVSEQLITHAFSETENRIGRSNTGYSLIWIKERIQLIQDESIKRLVKTYYSQLLATPQTDSNYVTLYSYLEAVARFPWEQVNAPLADPEDYETLLKRMAYAEKKFNETHFGMTEVQRIIRHTLQSNWRRLNHRLPPRGLQYTFLGSPGTGKTSAVPAMARAITYNGPQGPMTAYGSWDIDMAGMDDPSNLLGFLRTYVGARWGSLYGGLIERGLYSIFGIDEPSRARTSQKGNPTDALTRFLDPAFRDKFTDTFIAFAVPLGPLMVVLLTNDKLPDHIEDRTTLVVIPDPTPEQLAQIGQRHTLTRVHKKFGIKSHLLTIDDSAMQEIVTNYVPHGARDLQRVISLLGAAAANKSLLEGEAAEPIHVTLDNLKSLLGSPPRSTSRNLSKKEPLPGEVLTFIDGMPSMVHAVHFPREDTDRLYPTISPLLDPPMKESAHLAFKNAVVNNPSDKKGEIFIDASGPKKFEGASSGLAYYMAVQSAITEQPIPKGVAYLGGIDATGRISKVSPQLLSESASNASKFGLTKLVLPGENKGDLEALFFNQPRLASRTRYEGKDTLRVPFKNAGPRPDWAAPEVIAMWEAESRQASLWNETLRSQELFNQAVAMNLTLFVDDNKGIQISGSQESLDRLLEEHVEFTPPLTFELIDNVNGLSPPSTPRQKPLEKIAASWIGAIATALILGNLINLAATFSVQAATVTAAASSAAWAVPLGVSLIILFMLTIRRNVIKNTPLPALLSDLIRIGFASPNPTYDRLVSEYARSGKMTPVTRLSIFGFLAPPLDKVHEPEITHELKLANDRAIQGLKEGHDFILPDTDSFLDLVGVGVGTDGAPPPVITFDWDSLKQGKTTTLLDGIAQGKPLGSILAFVSVGKGQTAAEMANYVETRWPGLDKSYRVVYVDSDQINKNDLGEVNKVHSEKLANYISRKILNGSHISLRVLVSSENRNRWVGLALDIFPIDAGYSVQGLLGAFRNAHLIFNIQA
ncbi:MAG: AAA family ATPase [Elusimicrobia bacterium]|nr:AAA family ATPase [Elusimicrobiota bacterium]